MIFTDKVAFLEMPKTGSTYARYILKNLPNSNGRMVGKKHNIFKDLSEQEKVEFNKLIKMISIRNPFDWYVSYFAFCCELRGGLYTWTVKRPDIKSAMNLKELGLIGQQFLTRRKHFKELFSDVYSVANFERFIEDCFEKNSLSFGYRYGLDNFNNFLGFYSYDFLRMTLLNIDELLEFNHDKQGVISYYKENKIVDLVLRNENLRSEMLSHSNLICNNVDEMKNAISNRPKKSNTATKRNPYQYYYSNEIKNEIAAREFLFLDHFKYRFNEEK